MRLAKKATAIALASVMAMTLAGCSSSKTAATTAAATTAAATEAATTAAATEAAKEAATTAAAATTGDVSDKKVGISIYKFDDSGQKLETEHECLPWNTSHFPYF